MSVLVIGGDNLGNIRGKLEEQGVYIIDHITGRKKRDRKIKIPEKTDFILVLTDYVGHGMTEFVKGESRRCDIKVVFSKRSWVHMEKSIQDCVKEITNAGKSAI